jgi:hypothetical protein
LLELAHSIKEPKTMLQTFLHTRVQLHAIPVWCCGHCCECRSAKTSIW